MGHGLFPFLISGLRSRATQGHAPRLGVLADAAAPRETVAADHHPKIRTLDSHNRLCQVIPCAAGIGDGGPAGIASSDSSCSPASNRLSRASGSYNTPTGFS